MQESSGKPSWTAPYRLVMALRLLRARKINLISIAGVMLGVASIIVVLAVMDGFQRELRAMIRGTLSDLIVEMYPRDEHSYEDIKKAVEAVEGVEAATLQRHAFGLIPARTHDVDGGRQNYLPVRIVGIIPEDERRVSNVFGFMEEADGQPDSPFELDPPPGEFIPEERPRVVISDWLARRMGRGIPYGVGEVFVLLSFREVVQEGEPTYVPNSRRVVVSRIYSSGNSEYDKLHVYVDLESTRRYLFASDEATISELRIKLDDYMSAAEMRLAVAQALEPFDPDIAALPEWRIQTWEERQHNLLRAVDNEKFLLAFVLFFIIVVACFTIFATLTMTVVEKTREIGVLRALGATPGGVMSIFMINGTLVGLIGAMLGYGLGLYVANHVNPIREFFRDTFGWDMFPADIYLFDQIPTYIDHEAAVKFAVGAALSALVFAVIPALRAARLRPVSALRYE